MTKKKKQSLTERIEALINRVGEKPEPTFGHIKSALVECLGLAQTLENSAVIRDLEEKVTVLETALEKSNLENSNLQAELQSLKTEVDGFRAERKKREEDERQKDLPEIQFKILQRLRSKHSGDWPRIDEVAQDLKIRLDEAEIHFEQLEKAGLAVSHHNEPAGTLWRRTTEGNRLVVAKRWAGEEEAPQWKYPDLPDIEQRMLAMMIGENEGIGEETIHYLLQRQGGNLSLANVNYILRNGLKGKGFADYDPDEETYGGGYSWFITDRGTEYFAERGTL